MWEWGKKSGENTLNVILPISNIIIIWEMQAKTLRNFNWAVVSSARTDIDLLFKSAKKEC